jgi:hypothetical protein
MESIIISIRYGQYYFLYWTIEKRVILEGKYLQRYGKLYFCMEYVFFM